MQQTRSEQGKDQIAQAKIVDTACPKGMETFENETGKLGNDKLFLNDKLSQD